MKKTALFSNLSINISKKNIFVIYLIFFYFLSVTSCSLLDFSPDKKINTNPSRENQIIGEDELIYISFNFTPDKTSAESLLQITDYKGGISGAFYWEDRRLVFTPDEKMIKGRRYTLDYSGVVLTGNGEKVKTEIVFHFFYITDISRPPSIKYVFPTAGAILNRDDAVTFIFSKSMDTSTVREGFKISPETEYDSVWNGNTTELKVSPRDKWRNLEPYIFSFSEEVCCFEKIPIESECRYTFYCRSSYIRPEVVSVYAVLNDISLSWPRITDNLNTIKYRDCLEIEFNLDMKKEITESSFSITPYTAGRIFWKDEKSLVFVPDKNWLWDKTYNIKVSETAEAENDISAGCVYVSSFTPDINELLLSSIDGKSSDDFPLFSYSENQIINIDTGSAAPHIYSFTFNFSQSFLTDTEKEKAQSSINISAVFPPDISSPYPVSYTWISDNSLTVKYTGFTAYNSDKNIFCSYLLTLKGGESGITNNRGSYFKEDIKQMLRTK